MSERVVEGVRLSNPDKVLYPEQGITKSELADYYLAVADHMLPHVANRPVTMVRCPTGQEKKCFYQRHAGSGVPEQLHPVLVPGFDDPYLYIKDVGGLLAMVQMGVLEIHPWGVTVERPDRPDRIVFDLDPDEELGFIDVVRAAIEVRQRLGALGLASFVRSTGGKGLHVVLPIEPVGEWRSAKAFAKAFSEAMAADSPDRYLTKISKAERTGRIFIDYLRNDPTSTAVGPYSTRSRPGAPVATPLAWEEVAEGLDPGAFNLRTVPERLARLSSDPWADIGRTGQILPDKLSL
ncbi:non-homologous end-joining DNA ligase [Allosphingosinicella sp.]|jgi:bifunctional non-homologous end joining protein LigD|uniref:non-homologous end-joining DNA ligase n=1 Tax=Allosphingosinicella sp. TaxID=2823234 RepID=UPI002F1A0552